MDEALPPPSLGKKDSPASPRKTEAAAPLARRIRPKKRKSARGKAPRVPVPHDPLAQIDGLEQADQAAWADEVAAFLASLPEASEQSGESAEEGRAAA
jgi:hypothetical protein